MKTLQQIHNILENIMILHWAIFLVVFNYVWPMGYGLDTGL